MLQNVPGAFGMLQRRLIQSMLILAVVTSGLLASCGAADRTATFALSIRNAGTDPLRLKVLVAGEAPPTSDLLIPAGSGVLETAPAPIGSAAGGSQDPVVIEVYTERCALLTSLSVGEGRTRIVIGADRSVTASVESDEGGAGALAPKLVPACERDIPA